MQGSCVKIQDLIGYVSKYMLKRPKSDLKQLMYADCRLCCKFHSPFSILAKYTVAEIQLPRWGARLHEFPTTLHRFARIDFQI